MPYRALVTRSITSDQPLTIRLFSTDSTEVTVPATVIIPANQASTTFFVTAVDDALFDGTQSVTVSANAAYPECGCTIIQGGTSQTVQVTDNEAPSLSISLERASAPEGYTFMATVNRSSDPTQELVVHLISSDPTEATVPETITIPAGLASAMFVVTVLDDGEADGPRQVIVKLRPTVS